MMYLFIFVLDHYYVFALVSTTYDCYKSFDHDETRTRNLLIRSQTPYPLGHAVTPIQRLKIRFMRDLHVDI